MNPKQLYYHNQYIKYKKDYIKHKVVYDMSQQQHVLKIKDSESHQHRTVKMKDNGIVKRYNRAALLLIENTNEPTIILFKDRKWGTHMEPGGRIDGPPTFDNIKNDTNDILLETAKRELQEETLNTLHIDKNVLNESFYFDHYNKKTRMYERIYAIMVNPNRMLEEIYYINKDILMGRNISSVWKETDGVGKFYLKDVINCIGNNFGSKDALCKNANGKYCTIYSKTLDIMRDFINECENGNFKTTSLYELNEAEAEAENNNTFLEGTRILEIF